ncbi:podocan isoform X2 [Diprion similis]|uniref:podocan isoform X2 n=1 Tax=Diprion similis TaxID=362088 RepID=UPI001EF7937F|nr:podocan isoform X2 [Diprion similis]
MKQGAALLLVVILTITTGVISVSPTTSPTPRPTGTPPPPPPPPNNGSSPPSASELALSTTKTGAPWRVESLLNPQEMLLEEIRSLDEETLGDKVQKENIETLKSNGKNDKLTVLPELVDEKSNILIPSKPVGNPDPEKDALNELMEDEDLKYNETDDILMADDMEWDLEDEDALDDELDEDEEILFEQDCPADCSCSTGHMTVKSVRCTKFNKEQSFSMDIALLKIENAPDVKLGPHDLREKDLQQLSAFSIVNTTISEFDKTAFDGLPDLFSVNLTGNGLMDIPPDAFVNNTQLNVLTISGNPLQYTQAKDNTFTKYFLDAPSVTEFDFSNNYLPRILPTTFARMRQLVYLSLRSNRLRAVERAIFTPLVELDEIDLSHNQLSGFPADVFDDNEYLELLRIAGNNFTTLASIKTSTISILDASKNRIKTIGKSDLSALTELEELYLRSNGLKRIHQHAFADLVNLKRLDLSDNKLSTLTEHHLRTNIRLESLIMNDNPGLETLPVFKSQAGSFSLEKFECADCGLLDLEPGTFDTMSALRHLNLASNRLSRLPRGLLRSMSALKDLDLSDNLFTALEVDTFQGARSLTKLNLAGNPLITLQVAPFLLIPNLERLDVSRCGLDRIWSDNVVPLPHLRYLSARGNRIEQISVGDLQATPHLSGLDISNNPLACDQEFNAAIQWLIDHGVDPSETLRYVSNYALDDYSDSSVASDLGEWMDIAKVVCDSMEGGPPLRPLPRRPNMPNNVDGFKPPVNYLEELAGQAFDQGRADKDEQLEDAFLSEEPEYQEYGSVGEHYQPWYAGVVWPVLTVILVTLAVVLLVANLAMCLSKRRGRGPVIRAPMILRPGLIDNKNCGLVYKPLQEEIPTPHMPKRGSFYSSSTFHYDKIVPESV